MKKIITTYKFGEFNIKSIHCDKEFKHIFQDFANENNIQLICVRSQAHVPCAERKKRTIKERVRSIFLNLPYRGLPKLIMKYLVIQTRVILNHFPAKYGLLQYSSPRMIMQQRLTNFDMHWKHYTGEYVLAYNDKQIKNNIQSKAIYLPQAIINFKKCAQILQYIY